MTESERVRKTRKLIEGLESFRVLCKQLDLHAGELIETYNDDLKVEPDGDAAKILE